MQSHAEIRRRRLRAQWLEDSGARSIVDVLDHMGPVQAQDYHAACLALGCRRPGSRVGDVEDAVSAGLVIRTWPLRGTLHFVSAADARWILELTGPRVIARNAGRYRQLELDDATFRKAEAASIDALRGGNRLTRAEMNAVLQQAGVRPDGQRSYHVLSYLGLRGIICFGPAAGRQPTFVLLDEWSAEARPGLEPSDAAAALARRYFESRGPARLEDFVWWSGLTIRNARAALEAVGPDLILSTDPARIAAPSTDVSVSRDEHLLPAFDEYVIAYRDRSAIIDPARAREVISANGIFCPTVLVEGRVVARWKQTRERHGRGVVLETFEGVRMPRLARALENLSQFYGQPVYLVGD